MMKNKQSFLLAGLLVLAIILTNIPITVYAAIYNNGYKLVSQYVNMTEDEVYNLKVKDTRENLLSEIKDIEKELKDSGDEIAVLPHVMALIEKKDEFSQDEILHLLTEPEIGVVLESALIRMYIDKNGDKDKLLELVNGPELNAESKEYIVALSDLSSHELKDIYYRNDNSVAIIAMKKLMVADPKTAFDIATRVFMEENKRITDEKLLSSLLGIGEYYSKYDVNDKQKELVIEKMKKMFNTEKDEIIKDNIVYSMARMRDFEVFKYVIESENIDTELKVSTIERNIDLLVKKASISTSGDELSYIEKAMRIHPILEVGEALKKSMDKKVKTEDSNLSETIRYIENNGVKGVFKYE